MSPNPWPQAKRFPPSWTTDSKQTKGAVKNRALRYEYCLLGGLTIPKQIPTFTRDLAFSAILIALFSVLRILLYPLIGGNPTFVILILLSAFFSRRIAFFSGIGFYIVTGFFLGFGIWVLCQTVAIFLIVWISSLLPKKKLCFCVWGVLSAFLYSFILLFSALPFVALEAMPAYILAGLPTDFARAATNVIFMLLLYRDHFIGILQKYK